MNMIRTVISLDDQEKKWLDKMAKAKHISIAKIIRTAIKDYRIRNQDVFPTDFDKLLNQTKGTWSMDEGLAYQQKIRDEWDK